MKTLRKNVDLATNTIAILQIEATLSEFGTLKPFLESILEHYATKCAKSRPKLYQAILVENKIQATMKAKRQRRRKT